MVRSIRLFPQLGLNLKSFVLCPSYTINFGFYLFLGLIFGVLSIVSVNFSLIIWFVKLGVSHLRNAVSFNIFVILSQLILGFLVWCLGWKCNRFERNLAQIWGKLIEKRNGLCSIGSSCNICGSKIQSLKLNGYKSCEMEMEDEVVGLRKKLRRERKRRKEAILDLEREREASASASEEAMAKIMFLHSEKAVVEREARQYRELMEKKQLYDQEIIEHLQFVIERLERGEVQMGDDEIEECIGPKELFFS